MDILYIIIAVVVALLVGKYVGKSKARESHEELIACCTDIVNTQKKVHPLEQESLDYMAKKIKA